MSEVFTTRFDTLPHGDATAELQMRDGMVWRRILSEIVGNILYIYVWYQFRKANWIPTTSSWFSAIVFAQTLIYLLNVTYNDYLVTIVSLITSQYVVETQMNVSLSI